MPSKHASFLLAWSPKNHVYELHLDGVLQKQFHLEDERAWQHCLETLTSFSFRGRQGRLSVLKEVRSRGGGYWYAYAYRNGHKNKRYLGTARALTLGHLEETASLLSPQAENRAAQPVSPPIPTAFFPAPTPLPHIFLLPKLTPPGLSATLVTRKRLLDHLDQALTHPLTLISASAGFGKTTLLSTWVARIPYPSLRFSWLSLDERDNNPVRFWAYIIAALRMHAPDAEPHQPKLGETALAMLYSPQPPNLLTILTTLINDLVISQQEIVLVLDDYHVIDEPVLTDSFQFLLDHLPAGLHVILAGRSDPSLKNLSRLRAQGKIVEIRDRDLRFTRAEAECFLIQTMHLPLTEVEVEIVEQRTEGWIAGLQLATLAMRTRGDLSTFIQQLSGSQRFILEYMQEEIVDRQPQVVQDFLLQTSVLTRLHASLCQTVTAQASEQDSQQMLLLLEKANLFLVPLDEEQHWYRFHSLFRDVLQARLHVLAPQLVPRLHQRAAYWYEQQGDTFEAVEHALAGEDYTFAAELMERTAEQMWSDGQSETLSHWFRRLPDTCLLRHGRLVLTGMLYSLNQTFHAPSEQWCTAIKNVEQMISRMEPHLEAPEAKDLPDACVLRNRIALLRSWILLRGWIAARDSEWGTFAERRRNLMIQMQELAQEEDAVWKMTVYLNLFELMFYEKKLVRFLPKLLALKQQAEAEHHEYEAVRTMYWMCEVYKSTGQLHQVAQLYREGFQRLQHLGKARAMFGYFHVNLAQIYWELNRPDEARSHLATALHFGQTWQHVHIQVKSYHLLLKILLAEGKLHEAEQTLNKAVQCAQHWSHAKWWVSLMRGRYWLALGDLAEVANWVERQEELLPPIDLYCQVTDLFLTVIQSYIALQRTTDALRLLAELLLQTEDLERRRDRIAFLALQVTALSATNEMAEAKRIATHLLTLTEAEGIIRIYLDAGLPMQQVLQSLLDTQPPHEDEEAERRQRQLRLLLRAFEQEAAHHSKPSLSPTTTSIHIAQVAFETLTPREHEVLRLLAQGATNLDIAEQLVISLATVKKHVANILNKLGVENRVQAVARARDYEML